MTPYIYETITKPTRALMKILFTLRLAQSPARRWFTLTNGELHERMAGYK